MIRVTMDRDVDCVVCAKTIAKGWPANTAEGKFWHTNCATPTKEQLFGGSGPAPAPGGAPIASAAGGFPGGPHPGGKGEGVWIQIAVWIPVERAGQLIAAIQEARRP